jgi:peptide/nickel transport system substrate-binding protein
MKILCRRWAWWLAAAGLVIVVGCSSYQDSSQPAAAEGGAAAGKAPAAADAGDAGASEDSAAAKPFKLGDLLEPFNPPPLAELDKTAGWVDRPVLSGMEELRQQQKAEGPPPVTVEEALALRNDSPEDNKKILDTLGRLAPADGAGVNYDTTWVRHVAGDLKSSNPLLISSVTEFEYQALTGFGLLTSDREMNYYASKDAVVSWQTSKDHLMDKFVLRDDLTWSDGVPITAHDIQFSFQVIMTDAVILPAVRQGTDRLRWVQAYDDHTVVFFHKEPLATNTTNMAFPIIPKHVYEKSITEDPTMVRSQYHSHLEDHPVVGGPYDLARRVRNQEFVVRRRESWYMHDGHQVRPKPYFEEIRVKAIEDYNTALLALEAGQIEEMVLRAEQWTNQTNDEDFYARNTKVTAPEWTEFHFTWNMKSPFFSDVRVRQAMSWAFDYHELLHTICHDLYQPCQGIFYPTSWMFPKPGPEPYHQDLDKAEDLLDAAGWTDSDGDGIRDKVIDGRRVPFEFTLVTYQTETGIQAATLMKESLGKIGVICNVKPTEFTVMMQLDQDHKFDASMGGWGAGTDPSSDANIFGTDAMRNYGSYSNKRVDELFEQGLREFDREKRAAIYGEIANILWHDQPYTWLFYRNSFYAFSKKLRGYNFSPQGPYLFDPGISGVYKPVAAP